MPSWGLLISSVYCCYLPHFHPYHLLLGICLEKRSGKEQSTSRPMVGNKAKVSLMLQVQEPLQESKHIHKHTQHTRTCTTKITFWTPAQSEGTGAKGRWGVQEKRNCRDWLSLPNLHSASLPVNFWFMSDYDNKFSVVFPISSTTPKRIFLDKKMDRMLSCYLWNL